MTMASSDHTTVPQITVPAAGDPQHPVDRIYRFDMLPSPIGHIAVTASDRGICDLRFRAPDEDTFRHEWQARGVDVVRDPDALAPVLTQLREYFDGQRRVFAVDVDLQGLSPFAVRVLTITLDVGFGEVRTYGEIATAAGQPGANRAVGGALGRNPIPIIIPCHRVLQGRGRLGGFTGGLDLKRTLLSLERRMLPFGSWLD